MDEVRTVPLTAEQRNWLRANVLLPTLFTGPIVAILGTVLRIIDRRFGDVLAVKLFVGLGALLLLVVLGAVALHVLNNLRDAREGALQTTARLLAKRESGRSPKTLYADFASVGTLIVMVDVYARLEPGRTYRITFSRHTKRCWSAEPDSSW